MCFVAEYSSKADKQSLQKPLSSALQEIHNFRKVTLSAEIPSTLA